MIFSLRLSLISLLMMLQFIAPLVHAHTSEKFSSKGIHIPGLEQYVHSANLALSNENLLCEISAFCSNVEGMVVGVDTGFSRDAVLPIQRQVNQSADSGNNPYLPPYSIGLKPLVFLQLATLPIQSLSLSNQTNDFSNCPRAPPQV
jgi:hypothetical protein